MGGDACRLFGVRCGADLSDGQLALWQWAQWYKSIYNMPASDRPADDIIQDDAAVDRWFDRWMREQQRKQGKKGGDPSLRLGAEPEARHADLPDFLQ